LRLQQIGAIVFGSYRWGISLDRECYAQIQATFVTSAAVIAELASNFLAADYSGLCVSRGRALNEREIIEIGTSQYLQRYLPINSLSPFGAPCGGASRCA
jgi:hypothetical protein